MARRMLMGLAIASAFWTAAVAGDGREPSGEALARDEVRAEASLEKDYVLGTWRLRASWPLQAAGALGAILGRRPSSWDCATVCEFRGFQLQTEAGSGGVQVTAGWASLVGETDRSGRWLKRVHVGYAVRGALMRTGGNSTLDPKAQTFAGIEGTVAATRTSISIGVYRRASHRPSSDPWIVGAGVGWGF